MDTPPIQYAKTSDGVNIAYAVFGARPAIVHVGAVWGNLHLYKCDASFDGGSYDHLVSRGWSIITYDARGCGSSDRDVEDHTLEGRLRDLDAVVEKTAPGRFAVWGSIAGGPPAIAYTVAHPDRVSHLILSNTYAAGAEWYKEVPAMRLSQQTLGDAEEEWEFATLTLANAFTGYADSELARRFAEAWRTGMRPKDYIAHRTAAELIDVRELLAQIEEPTIVIHDRGLRLDRIGVITQRLAPLIPNARFVETDNLADVIDEFLREGEEPSRVAPHPSSSTAVILFADIVDSTALTERIGDTAFREKARGLDEAMRAAIRDNGGTAVEGKTLGDGVLAIFTSAKQAISCAQACHEAAGAAGLALHAGIHAGDVIREADPDGRSNVYGGAVNIAARVAAAAAAGETLVSGTVRELARTSAGVAFEDRGEQVLKGIDDPVRVWAVREGEA